MRSLIASQAGREGSAEWHASAEAWLQPQLQGRVLPELGGFRLLRQIGQGRRAAAWLAQHPQHGAAVLKLAQCRPGATGASPFALEFEVAAGWSHPHVVGVLEQGCAGNLAYLAMEYVDGGDLAQRLHAALAPAEALRHLREAALGLAQLHRRGLVHRDVKPANLLLRSDGGTVLADFGLVARAGTPARGAEPGSLVGTPRYVAPEQLERACAQPAADVYSLGVVLHQMLAGRPPFGGQTLMEVLSQQLVAAAPPLPQACPALQGLCDAMLAKDAAARLPDADAVLERLDRLQPEILLPAPAGPTGKRWTS